MSPASRWFGSPWHGPASLGVGGSHLFDVNADKGTRIEPLSELLALLRAANGVSDDDAPAQLPIGEPLTVSMWRYGLEQPPAARPGPHTEQPFRPTNRPPTPLLTVLDDGAAAMGDSVRLRDRVCLIGRNEGTVRIPHDPLISSRHAELVRSGLEPPYAWHLNDVGSTNGTFVCCKTAPLRPDRIVILGSRRFRLHLPNAGLSSTAERRLPSSSMAGLSVWPELIETTTAVNPLRVRLAGTPLSIGRPGFGNQIEIDDPLLAHVHAVITQTEDGTWWIHASPSLNGVWTQVQSVQLTDSCRFQCGEQRFLFMLPG